jgi:putative transposase
VGGLQLTGEGGVLQQLTKRLLEAAVDGEFLPRQPGQDRADRCGPGADQRAAGPRCQLRAEDRGQAAEAAGGGWMSWSSHRRPRGLTTGEIASHLAEVYGADVSRQTISTITDKVIEGMTEWQNRPLDVAWFLPVYANPDGEGFACRGMRRARCRQG